MEEAAELANYLPLSFKTPKEQEYIEFLCNVRQTPSNRAPSPFALADQIEARLSAAQRQAGRDDALTRQTHFVFTFLPYHSRSSFSRSVGVWLGPASSLSGPCSTLQPFHSRKAW